MSLGFLTESALIPKKSKEIKVDKSIVVGLKSVIAQQERKQDEEDLSLNPRKRTRKVTNPKPEKKSDRNPGIDERIRRDEEEVKSDSMKEKLRKLEEKAELFHKMQRGEVEIDEENTMIDFNRRKQMFEFYDIPMRTEDVKKEEPPLVDGVRDRYYEMLNSPHKPDEVLIEDEFGRLRWVKHGSVDHMNNIGSSYRIRKQMQGGLENVEEKKPTSKAARVKMTWENRLQGSERDFFVEIDRKTEELKKKKLQQKEQPVRTNEGV
ncbi:hypothetical protein JH06_2769 [Blastocystis sp. subtype 4]|uniref:hypothetical protein n=1 Tax=Blastocystis sp. subtype 4 TaxID=944170 RepID=UPI00071175A9|nr:hypothetical protein JH06_2769 [Blastocystis sp. subtype 4]KNB43404.1 hypothetical protein JH06_2769 [Blastocystis sp. subtype 4]|eukprot:XP_014526847.1 hypothetical protein JH06_2769 [Blastocystis sp. subtype 4]